MNFKCWFWLRDFLTFQFYFSLKSKRIRRKSRFPHRNTETESHIKHEATQICSQDVRPLKWGLPPEGGKWELFVLPEPCYIQQGVIDISFSAVMLQASYTNCINSLSQSSDGSHLENSQTFCPSEGPPIGGNQQTVLNHVREWFFSEPLFSVYFLLFSWLDCKAWWHWQWVWNTY